MSFLLSRNTSASEPFCGTWKTMKLIFHSKIQRPTTSTRPNSMNGSQVIQIKQHELFATFIEETSQEFFGDDEWLFGDTVHSDIEADVQLWNDWIAKRQTKEDATEHTGNPAEPRAAEYTPAAVEPHTSAEATLAVEAMPAPQANTAHADSAEVTATAVESHQEHASPQPATSNPEIIIQKIQGHEMFSKFMQQRQRSWIFGDIKNEFISKDIWDFDEFLSSHGMERFGDNEFLRHLNEIEHETSQAVSGDGDLATQECPMVVDTSDGHDEALPCIDEMDVDDQEAGHERGPGDYLEIDHEDILLSVAKAQIKAALQIPGLRNRMMNLPRIWSLATTCTGSGGFELAARAVAKELTRALTTFADHASFEVQLEMACEIEKFKQQLLINHVLPPDCCLFQDVTCLKTKERTCVRHGSGFELPKDLFGFVSGFSCKSLSKLQNSQDLKKAIIERNQESSSFQTFCGNLDVLDECRPLWFLMENVDMGDPADDNSNSAAIQKLLRESGYTVRMVLLKASDFALPQRRKRLFLIGVSNQRAQDEMKSTPDEILDRVVNVCLPAMRLSPPDVDIFLLNDDDPDVFAELDRRTKSREKKKQDLEKRMQEQPAESAQAKGEKWKDLHMQIAASRNMQWPIKIPHDLRDNDWFKTLPLREQEIVALVNASNENKEPYEKIRFADLYHSANRTPVSQRNVVPTVLPSGTVWDYERDRLHLGCEQLALQGIQYASGVTSALSNNQQQDLAGNAFPTTIVSAILISIVSSLDYVSDDETEMLDGISELLKRLK
ncbi:unnamed protein product [Durusdinium trenchii]|uniref:DNA (cytosine-5-)-methyltransferase n=2 Tax=Durusdinium trenchii TaxID=1381693 RepID=A0ABP0L2S4_9DINO